MRRFSVVFILGVSFALLASTLMPRVLEAPVIDFVSAHLMSQPTLPQATLLLGGDVMLSRQVERIMRTEGSAYPFRHIKDLFAAHERVLVNFEGTVPLVHVPTPSMGFSFSVAADIAEAVASVGITHAGLSNNHAFDFGADGYKNAKKVLGEAGITAFGHPEKVEDSDITYVEIGGVTVAIVPIHTVFRMPNEEAIALVFAHASAHSDLQIAYVHWGVEYEPIHDPLQEEMATDWIEAGADAVVGHHPHVVQDIVRIDGVPVFYSLGNLLFDQYWNIEVRSGLLLSVSEAEGSLSFTLIPVVSEERSVPAVMAAEAKQVFLESLAARSSVELQNEVLAGVIRTHTSILVPTKR